MYETPPGSHGAWLGGREWSVKELGLPPTISPDVLLSPPRATTVPPPPPTQRVQRWAVGVSKPPDPQIEIERRCMMYQLGRRVLAMLESRPTAADPFWAATKNNTSRLICREDFCDAVSSLVEGVELNESKRLFGMADTDDDGFLTHAEVIDFLYMCKETREGHSVPTNGQPRKKTAEELRKERKADTLRRAAKQATREMQEKMKQMVEEPEEEMDLRYMARIVNKAGIKVTSELIRMAMKEFKRVVPTKTGLDINQFDIVMKRIGFTCPFDRHRLFRAFDFDFNNTVEYCEFIWGIAMLFNGSLAQQFDALWRKLVTDGSGLHEDQLYIMLRDGGCIKQPNLLRIMCERIFQRLDKDMSGSIDYEEFQLGLLEDTIVASIFDKCMSGKLTQGDISNLVTDTEAARKKSS